MITTIRCKPTTCAYMGSQYTSAEFNIKCQNYGLKHSYSLKAIRTIMAVWKRFIQY